MLYLETVDANTFRMHGDDLTVKPDLYPKEYEASAIKVPNETEPRVVIKHGSLGNEIVTIRDIRALSIDGVVYATAELAVTAFNTMIKGVDATDTLTNGSQTTTLSLSTGEVVEPNGNPSRESVEVTRPANITAYAVGDAVGRLATSVAQVEKVTLTGAAPTKHKYTLTLTGTSGTAQISGTGTLTKVVTFATGGTLDLPQTANDYFIANAAFYAVEGVTLTQSNADLIFESDTYGTPIVIPTIVNLTGNLAGTVVQTTANVVVGTGTITGTAGVEALVSFDVSTTIDLAATAALFAAAYVGDYASEGVDLTSSGADIIFTAASAGTSFIPPVFTNTAGDLAGVVVHFTANDNPDSIEFENMAIANGGGGFLVGVKIESNIVAMAATAIRLWLYNEAPALVSGDNAAFLTSYADRDKLIFFVDVEMQTLETGSDSVVGYVTLAEGYKCADTSLFGRLETKTVFTPTSGGKINVSLSAIKIR